MMRVDVRSFREGQRGRTDFTAAEHFVWVRSLDLDNKKAVVILQRLLGAQDLEDDNARARWYHDVDLSFKDIFGAGSEEHQKAGGFKRLEGAMVLQGVKGPNAARRAIAEGTAYIQANVERIQERGVSRQGMEQRMVSEAGTRELQGRMNVLEGHWKTTKGVMIGGGVLAAVFAALLVWAFSQAGSASKKATVAKEQAAEALTAANNAKNTITRATEGGKEEITGVIAEAQKSLAETEENLKAELVRTLVTFVEESKSELTKLISASSVTDRIRGLERSGLKHHTEYLTLDLDGQSANDSYRPQVELQLNVPDTYELEFNEPRNKKVVAFWWEGHNDIQDLRKLNYLRLLLNDDGRVVAEFNSLESGRPTVKFHVLYRD